MTRTNQQVIDHLNQISFLFLKDKDQWRSRAFSRVAGELSLISLVDINSDRARIKSIPGVGKAIEQVINEFLDTGTSKKFEKMRAKLPDEVIKRFDAKTAKRKVNALLKPLTEAGVDWGFAGSMRRGMKTVRDVDVVVCLNDEEAERELLAQTLQRAHLEADVRNGQEKIGVSVPVVSQGRAFTLDMNFCHPETKGAMYFYFTGPKAFNIAQRAHAKKLGLRLNQKGLWKGRKCIAGETEKELFEALGIKYLAPDERA